LTISGATPLQSDLAAAVRDLTKFRHGYLKQAMLPLRAPAAGGHSVHESLLLPPPIIPIRH
jgi:hypothetical protein